MEHALNVIWPGWEVVRTIGRGSFGSVYELQRDSYGHIEKSALKVITIPQNNSDIEDLYNDGYDAASVTARFESYLKDIIQEYSMMVDMKGHANIVYCDDFKYVQHDDGIGWDIYIRMELLTPLTKTLGKDIPEDQVINLGIDLCNALVLCKQRNIVHRDIKPQNIFVSDYGTYKLGDFGIAKTAERTTSGTKIGTYKYMAPEVYKSEPYGSGADIYSLGLVLYWMLNDRRTPFLPLPPQVPTSGMEDEARHRRFSGEPLPPPAHGSQALKDIVLKACAYNPSERYSSAAEMLAALQALKLGMPIPAFVPPVVIGADEGTVDEADEATVAVTAPETAASPTVSAVSAEQSPEELVEDGTVGLFAHGQKDISACAPSVGSAAVSAAQKKSTAGKSAQSTKKATASAGAASGSTAQEKKRSAGWIIGGAVAVIILIILLLLRSCGGSGASDVETTEAPRLQTDWSNWSDALPDYVNEDEYIIEEQTLYSSRQLETTSSTTENQMNGWELYETAQGNGEFGAWSEWSTTAPASADSREIEQETRYRYRDKETTTSSSSTMSGWTLGDTTYSWGDYGSWSSWSTTAASASDSRQVETKTQYSYRDKQTTTSTSSSLSGWTQSGSSKSYGSWSAWSDTAITASSTLEVETQKVQTGTKYFMAHYCTGNISGCAYQISWSNNTTDDVFNAKCTYHNLGWFTSLSSFKANGTLSGKTKYEYYPNGSRYRCSNTCYSWFILDQENVYKTQYRSRSVTTTYSYYKWGDWSDYSDSSVSASSTREVQTRTMYRYRDRSQIASYTFWKWGNWTDWSTAVAKESDSRQVETATYYRYRDRVDETTYYFRKWSEWTDYTSTAVSASDTVEVQTKTQYRYKSK